MLTHTIGANYPARSGAGRIQTRVPHMEEQCPTRWTTNPLENLGGLCPPTREHSSTPLPPSPSDFLTNQAKAILPSKIQTTNYPMTSITTYRTHYDRVNQAYGRDFLLFPSNNLYLPRKLPAFCLFPLRKQQPCETSGISTLLNCTQPWLFF